MADIGVPLDPSQLVLTRGRDFSWSFQNLDENDNPINFPSGRLFFELDTGGGHNSIQTIKTRFANGGTYRLGRSGNLTGNLNYNFESDDLQAAISALPGIGAGNVAVTGLYYPEWVLTVTFTGSAAPALPTNVQGAIQAAVSGFLDGIEWLSGGAYDLSGVYTAPTWRFTVTAVRGMDEESLATYVTDILNTGMQSVIGAIAGVGVGNVSVAQFYAPKREFKVEYTGALANSAQPKLSVTSSLTGSSPSVTVDVASVGAERYTYWDFSIDGASAFIKVDSEAADLIQPRTSWQLVFLPASEPKGGTPLARGKVSVQS